MSLTNPGNVEEHPWSTGLCDCCGDIKSCCITFWCPCITFGQISEILDKGATSCCANCATFTLIHLLTSVAFAYPCTCFYSYPYRARLRREFELKEYPCNDCLVHFCCMSCALCQEYRELKSRGFNVEKGWAGNASQHGEVAMAPKVEGGMRR
ncbi:protein PLANT CADMIUM RESISTANCE 2 isoform X2 [Eucalyptus grandis]|uniref:protein PLANT CADMIUM RESISTANCE 2 isoform X2 n=1 Tax=Eucalyptus grandis TaxID=71139 RepID=UPI00192F113B|nr:protein PLANT CADMIUM RESISTANCE 2 isoform X2 [Eucalyptus grandis]